MINGDIGQTGGPRRFPHSKKASDKRRLSQPGTGGKAGVERSGGEYRSSIAGLCWMLSEHVGSGREHWYNDES